MAPIIGMAMRCMISEPAPVLQKIGTRPAMMGVTVVIFGRTRPRAAPVAGATDIEFGQVLAAE